MRVVSKLKGYKFKLDENLNIIDAKPIYTTYIQESLFKRIISSKEIRYDLVFPIMLITILTLISKKYAVVIIAVLLGYFLNRLAQTLDKIIKNKDGNQDMA